MNILISFDAKQTCGRFLFDCKTCFRKSQSIKYLTIALIVETYLPNPMLSLVATSDTLLLSFPAELFESFDIDAVSEPFY